MAHAPLPKHELLPKESGVRVHEWTIRAHKGPICNAQQLEQMEEATEVHHMPEMVFGANGIEFSHAPSKFHLILDTVGALKGVRRLNSSSEPSKESSAAAASSSPPSSSISSPSQPIRVSSAEHWGKARDVAGLQEVSHNIDWTYTTDFKGTILIDNGDEAKVEVSSEGIDYERLKAQDEILYFTEIPLFEDELHDNGISNMIAKVRVMPNYFFCLLRFFLRVDGVLFRIMDTRLLHFFGTEFVFREHQVRELGYKELAALQPVLMTDASFYSDPNRVAEHLPCLSKVTEKIYFPK